MLSKRLPSKIREFKEGDEDIMSASRLNEIVAVANCLLNMKAGRGIKITKADSNIIIERTTPPPIAPS